MLDQKPAFSERGKSGSLSFGNHVVLAVQKEGLAGREGAGAGREVELEFVTCMSQTTCTLIFLALVFHARIFRFAKEDLQVKFEQ